MAQVTFRPSGKTASAGDGEWLYDVCERAGSGIPFACKAGACGTCATEVVAGAAALTPQTAREVRTLRAHGLDPETHRLPCLCDVHGDVVLGAPAAVATGAARGSASARSFTVEVESYRPLNATVCEIRFFVPREGFTYEPGQYVILDVPGERPARRSYSITVPPSDRRHFEVCVRAVAGGRGSNYVHALRPGDSVSVAGPFGHFVLQESSARDILMIATGTGIAPLKSMLLHLLHTRSDRRVRLFFGVRHESDLFYTDLMRGLKAHYPAFGYQVTLSAPEEGTWAGRRGRVTDLLRELVTDAEAGTTEAYLCGSKAMILGATEILRGKGFPPDAIRHESFY